MVEEFDIKTESGICIAYYSFTGQNRRFIEKTQKKIRIECININSKSKVDKRFILLTSTLGFGQVPDEVKKFLENNHKNMIAVVSSGNRNWGSNFAKSGDAISEQYNVPLINKQELSGSEKDVAILISFIEQLGGK